MTTTISDDVAKMLDHLQNIEKAAERAAMLTKQMVEPPLPEPPIVEPDRTSPKRRRRTRYIPLPGIMENAVYLAPSAWLPTRAPDVVAFKVWTVYEMARWAGACHYPSFSLCLSQRKTAHPSFMRAPCTWRSRQLCSCTPWETRQTV